jgi:hypothetical protein
MVAKVSEQLKDVLGGDFPEGGLKRLLGAIPAKYRLEVLCVSQDCQLVDASARLPLLLHVKSHVPLLPNPGPGWKEDGSETLMKFDRAKAHQR